VTSAVFDDDECPSTVVDAVDVGGVHAAEDVAVVGDAALTVHLAADAVESGAVQFLSVYDFDREETTIPLTGGGRPTAGGDAVAYRTAVGGVPRQDRYQVVALASDGPSSFATTAVGRVVFDFHCSRDD
jgi:hypothetical protein